MKQLSKRIVSMLTVLAMVLAMTPAITFADTASETADVCVTIAKEGNVVMMPQTVTVTDIDSDGALTINDALYAAHEVAYEGGAADGYGSAMSSWGLSITKLWGDTSGAFGYCVNDTSAMGLADPVTAGDSVYAYIYSDQVSWSDKYSYFDKKSVTVNEGEIVELTLSYIDYDADWNKVACAGSGAAITVDGTATEYVTDEEGVVTLVLDEGTHIVSAISSMLTLVPPICFVTVNAAAKDENEEAPSDEGDGEIDNEVVRPEDGTVESEETDVEQTEMEGTEISDISEIDKTPQTGDDFNVVVYGLVTLAALVAAAMCLRRKTCK